MSAVCREEMTEYGILVKWQLRQSRKLATTLGVIGIRAKAVYCGVCKPQNRDEQRSQDRHHFATSGIWLHGIQDDLLSTHERAARGSRAN
jgi:hypothetical protein